jgi:phosphatidylinositol alpha-1,6-mannosyltransferase
VLCVGRLVQHKGIEQLIDAMPLLPPPARLLIVGEGDMRAQFEERARASAASDRITFLGRATHAELPDIYRGCDVFVLPSVSRLEAFGIVALEAMASGLPVVASDIPGVREVVEEGVEGRLANPLDPRDLADKINDLLVDPLRRARYGRNGRAKVLRDYTWEHVAARVHEVYELVLHGKAPAESAAPASVAAV